MKQLAILILATFYSFLLQAQLLPGFKISGLFNEQQIVIENSPPGTRILINAPLEGFGKDDHVLLVIFALPNGNTIEQTFGKKLKEGDDWHFDIQHIGAQTRFLRGVLKDQTLVVAYLENSRKSWPAWNANTPDYKEQVTKMVNDIRDLFTEWDPQIVLNGHSGGGRFIFSYLDASEDIPEDVVRISFLDSNYGYEDTVYGPKLVRWLRSGKDKYLCALAYNDSVVIYNEKPLVSPTGGTWYRTRMMQKFLSGSFRFRKENNDTLIWYSALKGRAEVILKTNPEKKIFHTVQVERNGFIHSMLSGTGLDQRGYAYFGPRAYSDFIADRVNIPVQRLNIPARSAAAESGSDFMKRIALLPLNEREEEIFKAISSGNIPDFLRNMITVNDSIADAQGVIHSVEYEVLPDYLAVGSNADFCRIPMSPHTAQRLADLFGASMITAKISDRIYRMAEVKLTPFNYVPVGNTNELVTKFEDHNAQIEKQLAEAGGSHGQLVAGIKKDVILASRLTDQHDRVIIYGWHKPDGKPIQPVYSKHVDWYVDYSHGIRFINNQVLLDGTPTLFTDILKDPVLFKLFSDEETPMTQPAYKKL
ncbi:MAG TPA: hypothetical protein VMV74_10875 [Bacteroidales bacterium]|nr:hypothetical protein [Bacteroidales bacterium]